MLRTTKSSKKKGTETEHQQQHERYAKNGKKNNPLINKLE